MTEGYSDRELDYLEWRQLIENRLGRKVGDEEYRQITSFVGDILEEKDDPNADVNVGLAYERYKTWTRQGFASTKDGEGNSKPLFTAEDREAYWNARTEDSTVRSKPKHADDFDLSTPEGREEYVHARYNDEVLRG